MSYDWTMTSAVFQIKKKHFPKVVEALRKHSNDNRKKPFLDISISRTYSLNDDRQIISDIFFHDFGLQVGFHPKNGDVEEVMQEGSGLGELTELFLVIAPWVKSESWVSGRGEDGSLWRWYFKDGTLYEQDGFTVYEEGECPLKEYCEKGCPFALICTTSPSVLRSAKCEDCGGEIVIKDFHGDIVPLARTTCKCTGGRRFNVGKEEGPQA